MARVDDWFYDFVDRHMARHPRADWPVGSEDFWDGFRSALVKHGVTEEVADAASVAMMESPPPFPDQLVSSFLAAVKAVWAASEQTGPGLTDRDAAVAASKALDGGRGCDDCGGGGFAARWRRESLGLVVGDRAVRPYELFYCRCPFGRWVERCHREGSPEARAARRRLPDLADFPALWGEEYRSDPGAERYRSGGAPAAMLKALVDRHKLERKLPPGRAATRPPLGKTEPGPEGLAAAAESRARQMEQLRGFLAAPGSGDLSGPEPPGEDGGGYY